MASRARIRFPLMALGMLALLSALWAGLVRLGWALPPLHPLLPAAHGPLMVSGFLGTLIGLERAVALGRRWAYATPLLTALGALALILGGAGLPGLLLLTLGSLGLVAVFVSIVRRHPALFTFTMGLGALAWFVGNGLWLAGRAIPAAVPWWSSFLVLTIAGERLELGRLLRLSRAAQAAFAAAVTALLTGLLLSLFAFDAGMRLVGLGMLGIAAWLLRHDVARRTVRQTGLVRFIALCLLPGYVWLGVSGLLAMSFGGLSAGPRYDAALHALFLGFVFSMIFGHAPLILPAVTGVKVPFHSGFYGHLALLQASLLLRVVGDLTVHPGLRRWGGLLNVAAVLLFLGVTAAAALTASRKPRTPGADPRAGAKANAKGR